MDDRSAVKQERLVEPISNAIKQPAEKKQHSQRMWSGADSGTEDRGGLHEEEAGSPLVPDGAEPSPQESIP